MEVEKGASPGLVGKELEGWVMDKVLHPWAGLGVAGGCSDRPWLGWGMFPSSK